MKKTATLNLIGNPGVGKSHLAQAMTGVYAKEKDPLLEGSGYVVTHKEVEGNDIRLRVWSTPGDPEFIAITRRFAPQNGIAVFVYDITDKKSFEDLAKWIKDYESVLPVECVKVILGNKLDLESERKVKKVDAERIAQVNGAIHVEVSATNGKNLDSFIKAALEQTTPRGIKRREFENTLATLMIDLNNSIVKEKSKETTQKVASNLRKLIRKAKADPELLGDPNYAKVVVGEINSFGKKLDEQVRNLVVTKISAVRAAKTSKSTLPSKPKEINPEIQRSVDVITKKMEALIKNQKGKYIEEIKSLINKENRLEVLRGVLNVLNSSRKGSDYNEIAKYVQARILNPLGDQNKSNNLKQYVRESVPLLNAEKQKVVAIKSDKKGGGKSPD